MLGFSHANSRRRRPGRRPLAYLKYLAHHPATRAANRHASSRPTSSPTTPSDGLVNSLADVYTQLGHRHRRGAARPCPRTPSSSPPRAARCARRTPTSSPPPGSWTSTSRRRPTSDSCANGAPTACTAARQLFSWPRPDGPPDHRRGLVLGVPAVRAATTCTPTSPAAGGRRGRDVPDRAPRGCPRPDCASTRYVDHLCRRWLGRAADARLLSAARPGVTGRAWAESPTTVITAKHAVASWLFPRLACALLDTPDHMTTLRHPMTDHDPHAPSSACGCRDFSALAMSRRSLLRSGAALGGGDGRDADVRRRADAGHLRRHHRAATPWS